ncbi:MAG: hypothetical protein Q9165_006413 [Trypethelium subeluteriae]
MPVWETFFRNVSRFQIIESTLREGKHFATACFDTETKIKIAKALDELGVDYTELTSPAASGQSYEDCKTMCKLGLEAKVPTHVHGLVQNLRGAVSCDIECHFHDDTGCSISNAYCALEAGATHVDASVLGIGERNRITKLGGFMARMIAADRDYVKSKYRLEKIKEIENLVAESVQVNIPFNNPITGFSAFTHKSGIHQKAILANPSTYEIIKPEDFGMTRYVYLASRITGRNAIKSRVEQLGSQMPLAVDDADSIIRTFHFNRAAQEQQPLLGGLTEKEQALSMEKEKELNGVGEKRALEQVADE